MNLEKTKKELLEKFKTHGFENFQQQNKHKFNLFMNVVFYEKTLKLTSEQLDCFLKNSNLKQQTEVGFNILLLILENNKEKNLYLQEEQWDYLLKNSDLKQKTWSGENVLMHAFIFNQDQNINFSRNHWDYLLENSDLKQVNHKGLNSLMVYIHNYKDANLSEKQWNYLLKNSNLMQETKEGFTAFLSAFLENDENFFSKEKLQQLWNPLSQQQKNKNFQMIIDEYKNLSKEDILFLLYDLQFEPEEKTVEYLQKNEHQEILQMIEKRNILWNLNKNLTSEKIDKILLKI